MTTCHSPVLNRNEFRCGRLGALGFGQSAAPLMGTRHLTESCALTKVRGGGRQRMSQFDKIPLF